MNDLISIIINVHNGELYIKRCIDSLLNQTYSNIEIIIIDDGSTDKTSQIINSYLDERIKIFHIQNRNLSHSRKYALSKISGNYFIFVDSDDWVETEFIATLYNALINNQASMAICSYYEEFKTSTIVKPLLVRNTIEEYINDLFRGRTWGVVWNKLFRTSIIHNNNIDFDDSIYYWEDLPFTISYALYCDKIAYVTKPLYHYIKYNTSSLTALEGININFNKEREKAIRVIESHLLISKKETLYDSDLLWIKFWIKDVFITHTVSKERIQLWRNTFPEVNNRYREIYKNTDLLHYSLIHNLTLPIFITNYYYKFRHFIKKYIIRFLKV